MTPLNGVPLFDYLDELNPGVCTREFPGNMPDLQVEAWNPASKHASFLFPGSLPHSQS